MVVSQALDPGTTTSEPRSAADERSTRISRCDELIGLARAGDQHAWQELVDEFTPMMRRTAQHFRLGDADCSDVVQSVWANLVEHLDAIRDGRRIAGWLATSTRREAMRTLRRREVPAEHWALDGPDCARTPDQVALDVDDVAQLRAALTRVPERDRRLLTMLMMVPAPDYTFVSERLGMPHGSIGPTRARALHRLRREMERTPAGSVDTVIPAQRLPLPAA
jgi:RNA polymerase sigma factor (sigma-70 family)